MLDIKTELISLLDTYHKYPGKREECVDRLFILVYYHRTYFGLSMTDDESSDFLAQLYPAFIENLFCNYDSSKSTFYTFVCACLKYKANFFLKNDFNHNKKLTVLMEQVKSDALLDTSLLENNDIEDYQMQEKSELYSEKETKEPNMTEENDANKNQAKKMKEALLHWFNTAGKKGNKKGERRLIFILVCKAASFIDDEMLKNVSDYLDIDFEILSYYVDKFRCEFSKCNKEMLEASARRDKYFVKRLYAQRMLKLEHNSEYSKKIMNRTLEYSIKKYISASEEIKKKLKNVSNRRIARITGISRSCIDRICASSKSTLEQINLL